MTDDTLLYLAVTLIALCCIMPMWPGNQRRRP